MVVLNKQKPLNLEDKLDLSTLNLNESIQDAQYSEMIADLQNFNIK